MRMRIANVSLLSLLLPGTSANRKHHKRRRRHRPHRDHHSDNDNDNNDNSHKKSINPSLIQTKSFTQTTSIATSVAQNTFPWQPQKTNDGIYRSPFGPKHKDELCDALTSSALPFDVDSSTGLNWNEFYAFLASVADAVASSVDDDPAQAPRGELDQTQMGTVYRDMTCECHYTFRFPLSCCQEGASYESDSRQPIQVTLLGLDDSDDASDEERQYRKNFCNGIMYILENEGIDLEIVADAIADGLNVDVTDVLSNDDDAGQVLDQTQGQESSAAGSTIATLASSVSADKESLANTETLSTESSFIMSLGDDAQSPVIINETEDQDTAVNSNGSNIITNNSEESTIDPSLSNESSIDPSLSNESSAEPSLSNESSIDPSLSNESSIDPSPSNESSAEPLLPTSTETSTIETSSNSATEPFQLDASTSSIMAESTLESTNNHGATIGIAIAALILVIAAITAVLHRKRQEQRRLAEFAGREMAEDDIDAESIPRERVVEMETAEGDKLYAELTPETSAENPVNEDETSGSEVSSVISVEHDEECAQISFEEQDDGGVEARVTVGSTLAAMGVASTVTGRLSAQQGRKGV